MAGPIWTGPGVLRPDAAGAGVPLAPGVVPGVVAGVVPGVAAAVGVAGGPLGVAAAVDDAEDVATRLDSGWQSWPQSALPSLPGSVSLLAQPLALA